MRIPLLIAGCPADISPCEVFLFEGNYEIVTEGLVDSLISLSLSCGKTIVDISKEKTINLSVGKKAKLFFQNVGTEKSISVYVNSC